MEGRIVQRGTRCTLCGSHEVESDEVLDTGWLRIARCVRCEHRWTERMPMLALAGHEHRETEVPAAA